MEEHSKADKDLLDEIAKIFCEEVEHDFHEGAVICYNCGKHIDEIYKEKPQQCKDKEMRDKR